jgi:TonB family protein
MLALAWTASLALVLVLALRPLCRYFFGPEAAFAVWWLPPLLVALSFVPLPGAGELEAVHALMQAPASLPMPLLRATDSGTIEWIWALGTIAFVARGAWTARAWRRTLVALPPLVWARGSTVRVSEAGLAGPAVLAGWRARIVLPADFSEVFSREEAALAVAHELMHVRRLDHRWLLLAWMFVALFWFHPLAWWCCSRFDLDMELACDAALLRRHPGHRSRYAGALLRHGPALSPGWAAGWHLAPPLLQRIRWIARSSPPRRFARAGAALMLAGVVVATLAARDPDGDVVRLTTIPPPVYPAAAIREKLQGTVIVEVDVSSAGVPGRVRVAQSAGALLDKATIQAVRQWHFAPTVRHGLPQAATARVPVEFELSDEAAPSGWLPTRKHHAFWNHNGRWHRGDMPVCLSFTGVDESRAAITHDGCGV